MENSWNFKFLLLILKSIKCTLLNFCSTTLLIQSLEIVESIENLWKRMEFLCEPRIASDGCTVISRYSLSFVYREVPREQQILSNM